MASLAVSDLEHIVKLPLALTWLSDLSSRISELFRLLKSTVRHLSLSDDVIVRISTMAMSPLFVDPSSKKLHSIQTLQRSGSTLLQTIVRRHSDLREIVCEELFTNVNRLPRDKKSCRAYVVENTLDPRWETIQSNSDISSSFKGASSGTSGGGSTKSGTSKTRSKNNGNNGSSNTKSKKNTKKQHSRDTIQMFTATVLQLVHACAEEPQRTRTDEGLDEDDNMSEDSEEEDDSDDDGEEHTQSMTVAMLKTALKSRSLGVSGKKSILVKRLNKVLQEEKQVRKEQQRLATAAIKKKHKHWCTRKK